MKIKLFLTIFCSLPLALAAQSNYAPLNEDYYHGIDRYEVKAGHIMPQLFTGVKPYKRSAIVSFIDSLDNQGLMVSRADKFNAEYLRNDSWEWARPETSESKRAILKTFYRKKSDLYHVDEEE